MQVLPLVVVTTNQSDSCTYWVREWWFDASIFIPEASCTTGNPIFEGCHADAMRVKWEQNNS
jgi:hypothetical protein